MPTWGQMLLEYARLEQQHPSQPLAAGGSPPQSASDILRRSYLKRLSEHSGRATIVYATAWLENRPELPGQSLSVNPGDMHGFMEVCSNLDNRKLDLIITSPGGAPEAAESIMGYLRTRFDHIRAVIPVSAMSAATMMALACDEIVMGSHSQLGPIDPQFTILTPEGPRSSPGQAIIDQFEMAKEQCKDPANIAAWLPMLRGLIPGLLAQCESARELSEEFARRSLEEYMFAGDPDATTKARVASEWFADYKEFKSHGRRVSRDDARAQNIKVIDLESDPQLQDLVLSVYHAVRITFGNTGCVKLVENDKGRAYVESMMFQMVGSAPPTNSPNPPRQQLPPTPGGAFGQGGGNRAERRAADRRKKTP